MLRMLLCALLAASSALSCAAFSLCIGIPTHKRRCHAAHSAAILGAANNGNDVEGDGGNDAWVTKTLSTTYETTLAADQGLNQLSRPSRLRRIFRKKNATEDNANPKLYQFKYDYDEMTIGITSKSSQRTTAIMLIHPIGVGIGRWYYDRLLQSLVKRYGDMDHRLVFLSPDLLGSATASGPTIDEKSHSVTKIPLLNITDWTGQVANLMAEYETKCEEDGRPISSWSVVANGGCSPIALDVAAISAQKTSPFKAALTNVVISSPPRLPFFLESTDPTKVKKSYRTLSGITGRLFWWYSLRNDGRFIQKFSERNLVGDAANLGEKWTPNCLKAARLHDGRSRYSTFAFLAGTLQDGCVDSLNALKNSGVTIDFIRGEDKRRNRAKSWFWTRKKKADSASTEKEEVTTTVDEKKDASSGITVQEYVNKNGNRGEELFVGGRISLAWEDSDGYAKTLMELLCE